MFRILDGYGVMAIWNSEQKVTITYNKRNKIINQHNKW
jgi:3-deoxy-D-manno-octulosonate 8-phosphate phosphatase KdsC-like HAD superfamily phosphatase